MRDMSARISMDSTQPCSDNFDRFAEDVDRHSHASETIYIYIYARINASLFKKSQRRCSVFERMI